MVRDPDRDVEREAERDQQDIGREDKAHGREARCAIGWRGAAERGGREPLTTGVLCV